MLIRFMSLKEKLLSTLLLHVLLKEMSYLVTTVTARDVQSHKTVSHAQELYPCRTDVLTETQAQVGQVMTPTNPRKLGNRVTGL